MKLAQAAVVLVSTIPSIFSKSILPDFLIPTDPCRWYKSIDIGSVGIKGCTDVAPDAVFYPDKMADLKFFTQGPLT